jgi:hypothetical protein
MPSRPLTLTFQLPDKSIHKLVDNGPGKDDPAGVLRWWSAGPGTCDCRRSDALRKSGVDMEQLPCGNTIEFISFE